MLWCPRAPAEGGGRLRLDLPADLAPCECRCDDLVALDEALSRLMSLASADGHSLPEQARRIVDAVELLARPGQVG